MYFYGARWYDPALGRFTQPDSIIPLATQGVQAWDRFAYVNNNAVKYIDPSGHGRESTDCGPDGVYCDQNASFEDRYGITFAGSGWDESLKAAVISAVKLVARTLGGINDALAWAKAFGYMKF